ncbi:MAG: Rpn family recombination-promoting nuclease/putative transposase [Calothrix sp. FI2-JRJ7]|nr:Rpn family recombination-promoting nuclease/putative transposase [Calothrix sp. FI2-JRJ7]
MTFINPKTDFAFKKIFGSKQSKDILIGFLNAILYQEKPVILDLEIIDPYQAPRIKGMKDSYLDVKASITGNKTVIIEMQVLNVLGFEKRVLYNAAKAFSIQLRLGEDYTLLNPVIALTITDFDMFEGNNKVISRYRLKEKEDLTDYSDDIELVFVELPKFNKQLSELETLSDKWLYFLKAANTLTSVPPTMEEVPEINHAFEVARESKLTRKELDVLEKREMFLHDSKNAILKAQQDGEAKGRKQGREEGAKEKALAIARSLLGVLDVQTISQTTGLSVAEVEQLQK